LKKPYQIEDRRAMQRFEASLRSREDAVQLMLPTLEIAEAMRNGVGELMRQAGATTGESVDSARGRAISWTT
jgi:hypothetical protein